MINHKQCQRCGMSICLTIPPLENTLINFMIQNFGHKHENMIFHKFRAYLYIYF